MNKILKLLLFTFLPSLLLAQNLRKIDSIRSALSLAKGKDRYLLMNDLAWEFRFAFPDSTIAYARTAYQLAAQLKLPSDQARALNYTGIAYNYKGDRLQAYDFFIKALDVSTQQHDSIQIAHSNNNIGRLLFEQGLLSKAYEYYVKSYAIFKKLNDRSGLAYTLQSLATLQRSQKDYVQSEKKYFEALAIRLALRNPRDILSAQIMLSRLYYEKKDYQKSTNFLLKADSIGQKTRDVINLSQVKMLLAKNYIELGKLTAAEQAAEEGAKVIATSNFKHAQPETMLILGIVNLKEGNHKKAEKYFKASLNLAIDIKDLQGQMDAFHYLWKLTETDRRKEEAIQYMNQYLLINDSIKDLDLTRQVERLRFQLEIEKKEKENELLKLRETHQATVIDRQRAQNILLFIVLSFSLSLAGAFWFFSRKRQQTNTMLEAQNKFIELQRKQIEKRNADLWTQNKKLADLNHEKDMLMNIVAHDLKSPLARIMGLANLLDAEGNLSQTQREYVRLLKDVTQSNLDLIVDLLDVNALQTEREEPRGVVFNLGQLLDERISFFQYLSINKKIDLHLDYHLENPIKSNPGYISRILDNLISNAIKFSKSGSVVSVKAKLLNESLVLIVKDNGPGFSDADKELLYQRFKKLTARPTAGESSNGLGLAIVKTLIDRLHGDILLTSAPGKGSEFEVTIPVKVVEQVSAE